MKSLIIIWTGVLLSAIGVVIAFDILTMPAGAIDCGTYVAADVCKGDTTDTKYDGDCQPGDTAGRCADKPLVLGAQTPAYVAPVINGFGGK